MTTPEERAAKKPSGEPPLKKTPVKKAPVKKVPANAPGSERPTTPSMADGEDVVRAASQIIALFEAQPDRFLAACANPVRGMRDAGVVLGARAARYVALRCRFSPAEAERLEQLAQEIDEQLGVVDPDDDEAITVALRKVGVEIDPAARERPMSKAPDIKRKAVTPRKPGELHPNRRSVLAAAETLDQVHRWRETKRTGPDPFEPYRGMHSVIEPLLEYRRQSATQPRFASDQVYEELARTKDGQLSDGINITLRVRLKADG